MNVRELKEALDHALDQEGGWADEEVEVRLVLQQHWPLEFKIDSGPDIKVIGLTRAIWRGEDWPEEATDPVIYLCTGDSPGYLNEQAKTKLGM